MTTQHDTPGNTGSAGGTPQTQPFSNSDPDFNQVSRSGGRPESTLGLLRKLTEELATLLRQELALARAQFTEALSSAKAGVVSLAAAGAILFAALLVLLAAAVLALAQVLPAWAAALIIGFILGAIGYGLLQAARKKLDPSVLKPTKTQQSLQRDKRVLERRHP